MEQVAKNAQGCLKGKTLIILLTGISFLFTFFFDLIIFSMIETFLMRMCPRVLFFLYVAFLHKKEKAAFVVPIIFLLMVIQELFEFAINPYGNVFKHLLWGFFALMLVLTTLSSFKGLTNKKFIAITFLIGIAKEVMLFLAGGYFRSAIPLGILCECIGYILFYISLLLFGVKNNIPIICFQKQTWSGNNKISPERALKNLKEEFDLGKITEEEYQAQRAEIISKL